MLVCLAPQLFKLLSEADIDCCHSSYMAKLNHVKQVIDGVKKCQSDHVAVAKEEVSSVLKPLTDELISCSDEAQQAVFNECDRDVLAKLDHVLGITEHPDVADIMNVKVVDTDIQNRVSQEMPKVAKGVVAAQNACRSWPSWL